MFCTRSLVKLTPNKISENTPNGIKEIHQDMILLNGNNVCLVRTSRHFFTPACPRYPVPCSSLKVSVRWCVCLCLFRWFPVDLRAWRRPKRAVRWWRRTTWPRPRSTPSYLTTLHHSIADLLSLCLAGCTERTTKPNPRIVNRITRNLSYFSGSGLVFMLGTRVVGGKGCGLVDRPTNSFLGCFFVAEIGESCSPACRCPGFCSNSESATRSTHYCSCSSLRPHFL